MLFENSRLASTTYGNGSKETYSYNAYGQLASVNKSGEGTTTWRYDALGRPYYIRDNVNARKTYFYYDVNNQTVGQHVYSTAQSNAYDTRKFGINRAFNDKGEMTKESLSAKDAGITNTFTYNENGQPTQTTLTSVRKISYGYDNDSRLTSRTTSTTTPIEETFTYNNDEALSTHRVKDGTRDDTYSYTYSDNGNITEIKKNGSVIKSYEYDDDNQLKRENDAENNRTVTYTYDGYGNILSKSVYAYKKRTCFKDKK